MSLLQGVGWEVAEQLDTGEVAICVRCEKFWLDRADLQQLDGVPLCESCGTGGFKPGYLGRQHKERSMESRWGAEVVAGGWTGMPDLLVDNLQTLGLDESHFLLLMVHESYRRQGRSAVWPSIDTVVERLPGWNRRKVERRLSDLRRLGLIESERRWRDGRPTSSLVTRNGLDAALLRLAREHAKNAATPGLTDTGVGEDASNGRFSGADRHQRRSFTDTSVGQLPTPVSEEAEEVEADEAFEADAADAARASRAATTSNDGPA